MQSVLAALKKQGVPEKDIQTSNFSISPQYANGNGEAPRVTGYQAKDGNRTMYFAFGAPDTVVLGSNEGYVTEALGAGKKAADNADLMKWIALADQKAPLWAAGRVDDRVRAGLVKVTGGQLKAGPSAMVVSGLFGM